MTVFSHQEMDTLSFSCVEQETDFIDSCEKLRTALLPAFDLNYFDLNSPVSMQTLRNYSRYKYQINSYLLFPVQYPPHRCASIKRADTLFSMMFFFFLILFAGNTRFYVEVSPEHSPYARKVHSKISSTPGVTRTPCDRSPKSTKGSRNKIQRAKIR